jgi:hypothetical protein
VSDAIACFTAIRRDWVGGRNEGVDFRRYHPELVADPTDG